MSYTLYSFWQSSSSWRVRIVLNIKHINYNYTPIDLLSQSHLTSTFQSINPMMQLPLLETPTIKLSQSLAIFQYLESAHPSPTMLASSLDLNGKMWEICEIVNSGVQPLQNLSILKRIKKLGGEPKAWAQEVIEKGFNAIEGILKETSGVYAVGDYVTFADACLLPQVNNAVRYGVDMQRFGKIRKVVEALEAVKEVQMAAPESQPDAAKVKSG